MVIPVIFEDDYIIVADKPSGIAVNRSENEKAETIQDFAENKLEFKIQKSKTENSDFINRGGIVHRLDKETSGLLIIAKNEKIFISLQKQFFNRTVKKKYLALVHGKVEAKMFVINQPVGRLPWNRRKFGIIPEGRPAETSFRIDSYYKDKKNNFYTLIEAMPLTGRTHQIRIHLKHIQHSIVSDRLYAGRHTYKEDLKFCPRLFLHAKRIEFVHPHDNKNIKFESRLPDELESVLMAFDKI